jgi:parallel beta-helix repeat protein
VALLSLLVVFLSAAQDATAAETVCDKYATTSGSTQRLVDSLSPGQVGCLRGGTYTVGNGSLMIKKSGVTLRSAPGTRATLNARIYVPEGAHRVTVSNLTIKGTKGKVNVLIRGDYTKWLNNDITNGHRDGISSCVLVGSDAHGNITATGTVIGGNSIHDCGEMPRTNHNHGIYVSDSRDARIIGNRIYSNADRGVQLDPDAQRTLVEGNTINGNAQGIVFSGRSSNNVVRSNVISNSYYSHNVYAPPAARGSNNLVERNCLWARGGGSGIKSVPSVFTARNNVVAIPGSALCRSVL